VLTSDTSMDCVPNELRIPSSKRRGYSYRLEPAADQPVLEASFVYKQGEPRRDRLACMTVTVKEPQAATLADPLFLTVG